MIFRRRGSGLRSVVDVRLGLLCNSELNVLTGSQPTILELRFDRTTSCLLERALRVVPFSDARWTHKRSSNRTAGVSPAGCKDLLVF